jgi:hypothetical protein
MFVGECVDFELDFGEGHFDFDFGDDFGALMEDGEFEVEI